MSAKYLDNLDAELILRHYNRPAVLAELVRLSSGKEVVGSFGGTGYAKRPDVVQFEQDILAQVKNGVTSFHCSEETWSDPLRLLPGMAKKELEALRVGWDLIIDVDCAFFEYSKFAADLVVQVLERYNIKSISVKFSGNHGFHIGVPYEAMPQFINGKSTATLFPEAPRLIAELLKELIEVKIDPRTGRGKLADAIWNYESEEGDDETTILERIMEKTGLDFEKLTRKTVDEYQNEKTALNAFEILEIDTILISSRHLCRMAYAVNEKSGMVSLPINPKKILEFKTEYARIEDLAFSKFTFLERTNCQAGEATALLRDAYDLAVSDKTVVTADVEVSTRKHEDLTEAIPEVYFPPMIDKILEGNLHDGRKRALFVLGAFLVNVGWNKEKIMDRLHEWNSTHPEPLRENLLRGQINSVVASKVMPPNFVTIAEYFGYSKEDLPRQRNPVNYTRSKYNVARPKENPREQLTPEQKRKRKEHRDKLKAMEKLEVNKNQADSKS